MYEANVHAKLVDDLCDLFNFADVFANGLLKAETHRLGVGVGGFCWDRIGLESKIVIIMAYSQALILSLMR